MLDSAGREGQRIDILYDSEFQIEGALSLTVNAFADNASVIFGIVTIYQMSVNLTCVLVGSDGLIETG